MSCGATTLASEYSVTAPDVVIRPIESSTWLVNQSAPSGPTVICCGPAMFESVYSVTAPDVVTRPIELVEPFVNQSAPSGPAAMSKGLAIPVPV